MPCIQGLRLVLTRRFVGKRNAITSTMCDLANSHIKDLSILVLLEALKDLCIDSAFDSVFGISSSIKGIHLFDQGYFFPDQMNEVLPSIPSGLFVSLTYRFFVINWNSDLPTLWLDYDFFSCFSRISSESFYYFVFSSAGPLFSWSVRAMGWVCDLYLFLGWFLISLMGAGVHSRSSLYHLIFIPPKYSNSDTAYLLPPLLTLRSRLSNLASLPADDQ